MDSTSRPVKWRLCSIEHILCRDDLASCAYFRCHYTCSQYSDTLPFPTHCSTPMKQIVGLLEFLKPITANLSFVQTHDSFYSKINPIQAYASNILSKYCKHSILLPGSISRKYFWWLHLNLFFFFFFNIKGSGAEGIMQICWFALNSLNAVTRHTVYIAAIDYSHYISWYKKKRN